MRSLRMWGLGSRVWEFGGKGLGIRGLAFGIDGSRVRGFVGRGFMN